MSVVKSSKSCFQLGHMLTDCNNRLCFIHNQLRIHIKITIYVKSQVHNKSIQLELYHCLMLRINSQPSMQKPFLQKDKIQCLFWYKRDITYCKSVNNNMNFTIAILAQRECELCSNDAITHLSYQCIVKYTFKC